MAYVYIKHILRKTASDNLLRDKEFSNAKSPNYDGYQYRLALMVYIFFDKKSSGANTSVGAIKS